MLNDGEWHHIAITHQYETKDHSQIYIDGQNYPIEWRFDIGDWPAVADGSILRFGNQISASPGNYNGVLDDIRIYDNTLTESEIDSLYHEGGWEK